MDKGEEAAEEKEEWWGVGSGQPEEVARGEARAGESSRKKQQGSKQAYIVRGR